MATQNYYKVLGVSENATIEEIKSAYRKLVKQYHPDKNDNPQSLKWFSVIQVAYETLSEPQKRHDYDQQLQNKSLLFSFVNTEKKKKREVVVELHKKNYSLYEPIYLTIKLYKFGTHFHLHGLDKFEILAGPKIDHYVPTDKNKTLTEIHYVLSPKTPGYINIGPASIINKKVKYSSNIASVRILDRPVKVTKIPPSRARKVQVLLTVIFLFAFSILIGYSYYTNEIATSSDLGSPGSTTFLSSKGYILNTGDSPYEFHFGSGIIDLKSFNEVQLENGDQYEAIVCLSEHPSGKTIRNHYMKPGATFTMTGIPDGNYFLKVLFGNEWDVDLESLDRRIKGFFNKNVSFEEFAHPDQILRMKQSITGDSTSFSVYRITLYPVKGGNSESSTIDPEDFFF